MAIRDSAQSSALDNFLRLLRRRQALVLFCLIAVPLAALVFSLTATKRYSASASLLFRSSGFDEQLLGSSLAGPRTDPTRDAATNTALVSLDVVSQRTARALGRRLTQDRVKKRISV